MKPLFAAAAALALLSTPAIALGDQSNLIHIDRSPYYRDRVLGASYCLVKNDGRKSGTLYFPKIPASGAADKLSPWVYWEEGNELILFEPRKEGEPFGDLYRSRRRLNLRKDVVETRAEIGTSTYLVERRWADEKIAEAKAGKRMVVDVDRYRFKFRCPQP